MAASIDSLAPRKSLIDLSQHSQGTFSIGDDFILSSVFDDIVLVEYIDEDEEGFVKRGEIYLATNSLNKAWRKAKVVLKGPSVRYCEIGDIVIFPNDKGASVANIQVKDYGKLRKGMFLNEQRLFGVCKLNESNVTNTKEHNG